jgi:hypothetical protein
MEELAAGAAAGQQRVGGINGPQDRRTVAQRGRTTGELQLSSLEGSEGPKPTRNKRSPAPHAGARGSPPQDVVRIVLGVRLRGLHLQPLRVGGIGRVPPLRAPRLLRPLRRLPYPLLLAPPVRRAAPQAYPMYVSPNCYSLSSNPNPSYSPNSSSFECSCCSLPPIAKIDRPAWSSYLQFLWQF